MKRSKKFAINGTSLIFLAMALLGSNCTIADTLIFTAAPRESLEKGHQLYAPVANFISRVLGKEVQYVQAGYWLRYQNDIKKYKYDFVFDGPHLASWRIKNIGHKPLIKLPGFLQFHILAKADNKKVNVPEDLLYKKVCVIPPPNLTAVTLLQRLHDPIKEPFIVGIKGGMRELYKRLIDNKCTGTVVRTDFYNNKLSDEEKAKVKIIYTSAKLPNQVITVSEKVSEDEKKQLINALLSDEGRKALAPVIKRFGGKGVVGFVAAEEHEYDGYSSFLEGVVLGW